MSLCVLRHTFVSCEWILGVAALPPEKLTRPDRVNAISHSFLDCFFHYSNWIFFSPTAPS